MDEKFVSDYVVAFVDLLGQTKKLEEFRQVPEENSEKFTSWQIETFGAVKKLRDRFFEYFAIAVEERSDLHKAYTIDNIKIQSISDSIVIYAPLFDEFDSNRLPVVDVATILLSLVANFFYFLVDDNPFRVGVEVGVGSDDVKHGLYGSAISNAYVLESTVANFPRIVVGKTLYSYLTRCTEYRNPKYVNIVDPKAELYHYHARQILDSLIPLENSSYMLDIFSNYFLVLLKDSGQINLIRAAYAKVESLIKKYTEIEPNEKILGKYLLLQHYFDQSKAKWMDQ